MNCGGAAKPSPIKTLQYGLTAPGVLENADHQNAIAIPAPKSHTQPYKIHRLGNIDVIVQLRPNSQTSLKLWAHSRRVASLRWPSNETFDGFIALDCSYEHPRKIKIRAKIGKMKHAQSKIRAATSRFSSRRVVLDGFSLLIQKRTLDCSLIRPGLVLLHLYAAMR
jgi:hypothetical protein